MNFASTACLGNFGTEVSRSAACMASCSLCDRGLLQLGLDQHSNTHPKPCKVEGLLWGEAKDLSKALIPSYWGKSGLKDIKGLVYAPEDAQKLQQCVAHMAYEMREMGLTISYIVPT